MPTVISIKNLLHTHMAAARAKSQAQATGSASRVVYLAKALALADALEEIVQMELEEVNSRINELKRG